MIEVSNLNLSFCFVYLFNRVRRKLGHACEGRCEWIKILGFEIVYASRVDGLMTDI